MKLTIPEGPLNFIMENEHNCVLRVYLRLIGKAQAKGANSCHVSANELSRSCGISVPSAIKGLKRLRELGFIETRHSRNPNRPCEHVIKTSLFSETKVALVAEPPFSQQCMQPFATAEDKFRAWMGGLTPQIVTQIKEIYGRAITQFHFRQYFDEFVLPLEANPQ